MVLLISFHRFYIMRDIFLHDVEPLTRCYGARSPDVGERCHVNHMGCT